MTEKKSKAISVGDVARALTVGVKFNKHDFAKLTGMAKKSVPARLFQIERDGFLKSEPGGGRLKLYQMTNQMRDAMLAKERKNAAMRGRRTRHEIQAEADALEEKKVSCYQLLQSVKFI